MAATIGGKPEENKPEWRIPPPKRPVPVIAFHGRADQHVPYEGGRSQRRRGTLTWLAVAESMAFWVNNNGLESRPVSAALRQSRVLRQTWNSGKRGANVVLYTIEQWGHVWPGCYFTSRLAENDPLKGFDAAELIWTFFKRY